MNLETLAGVYTNAKTLSRLLGTGSNIQDRVKRVLDNDYQRLELIEALESLESHLRVMGRDEVVNATIV